MSVAVVWLGFWVARASAYETDQLTRRADNLVDARIVANAEVNRQIAGAIAETNASLGCEGSTERMRKALATALFVRLATPTRLPARGTLDGLGFGAYAAFLETADIERRDFRDRSDIYGQTTPTQSLILSTLGVSSTLQLAGVRMGTDKADHFFGQGFDYFRESQWGAHPARAVRWGTDSELGAYGLLTSNVFSFADLHANRRGFVFYSRLLRRGSEVRRGKHGCLIAAKLFDWGKWVDDAFDEVLNPSVYAPTVAVAVAARLVSERDAVCVGYRVWGADVERRRRRVHRKIVGDAWEKAPVRPAGTELRRLCGADPPVVRGPWVEAVPD